MGGLPNQSPLSTSLLRSSLTVRQFEATNQGNLLSSDTVISASKISGIDVDPATVVGDRSVTAYGYKPADAENWVIGLVNSRSVELTGKDGDVERHSWSYDYDSTTNLLAKVVMEPGKGPSLEVTTELLRYNNGLLRSKTVTAANKPAKISTYFYDSFGGATPTSITNPGSHTQRFFYSPRLGVPLVAVDPSGVTTQWQRDGFGQVRAEIRGAADRTDVSYSWDADAQRMTIRSTESTGAWQEEVLDNRGFPIVRTRPRQSGGVASEVMNYDTVLGLQTTYGSPGDATGATQVAIWTFDRAGRLTKSQVEQQVTEYEYNGRQTDVFRQRSASGAERRTSLEADALGRRTKVKELGKDGAWLATEYKYGVGAQLKSVSSGPDGAPVVQETIAYEGDTGRRKSIATSSAGITRFAWTAFGDLEEEERAKSEDAPTAERQKTVYDYDPLGRRKKMTVDGKSAFWSYDDGVRGVGRLSSAISLDGVATTYSYGGRGWLTRQGWEYQQKQYALNFAYDGTGRLSRIDYPGTCGGQTFAVGYGYDDGADRTSQLADVSDPASGLVFWRVQSRDPHNQLRAVEMDVVQDAVGLGRTYERSRAGLITRIATNIGATTGPATTDLNYDYTASRRVWKKTDAMVSRTETLGYDSLDRLETWQATGQSAWTVNWGYDDSGNLKSRQLSGSGAGETITYNHDDTARPQLVTSSTFGGYGYDWKGNRIQTPEWNIDYSSFDLPKRVLPRGGGQGQSYLYDAENQRFSRASPGTGESTIYAGGLYERRNNGTNVYYVPAEDGVVAQVECDDSSADRRITYLEKDYQGTIVGALKVTRDTNGVSVERTDQAFDPFGNSVSLDRPALMGMPATVLASVRPGYTGHEQDRELGFINMNGRMFDPKTARFLSADPFATGIGSQSVNRFAYVENDPGNFVDPSGFQSSPTIVTCSAAGDPKDTPLSYCGPPATGGGPGNFGLGSWGSGWELRLGALPTPGFIAGSDGTGRSVAGAGSQAGAGQGGSLPMSLPLPRGGGRYGSFPGDASNVYAELPTPGLSYPDYRPYNGPPVGVADLAMLGGLAAGVFAPYLIPELALTLRLPVLGLAAGSLGGPVAGRLADVATSPAGVRTVQNSAAVLSHLFGRGAAGAQAVLAEVQFFGGQLIPPPGLTSQMLLQYRDAAMNAVMAGKDTLGVQAMRLQIIDAALNLPFLK